MELSEIAQAILEGTIEKQRQLPASLPDIEGEPAQIIEKFWNEYDIRTSLGIMRVRVDNPDRPAPIAMSDWLQSNLPTLNEHGEKK